MMLTKQTKDQKKKKSNGHRACIDDDVMGLLEYHLRPKRVTINTPHVEFVAEAVKADLLRKFKEIHERGVAFYYD